MEMLLLLCYSLSLVTLLNGDNIFRGIDDLDQELAEDIIPGGDVNFGEFPFVAAVFNALRKYQTCTGTIITDKFVLSSGYCVAQGTKIADPHYVSVLGGVVDMRDHSRDQWRYAVSITGNGVMYRDVESFVLIKVSAPFFENYSVKPIKFNSKPYAGNKTCTAITWRFRDKLNRVTLKSLVLKQYSVGILDKASCLQEYGRNPALIDLKGLDYICLNSIADEGSHGHSLECVGIDGSLVICDESGRLRPTGMATSLIGGSGCNRMDVLFTFFDIGAGGKWIRKQISKATED